MEAGLKADLKLANEARGILRAENEKLVSKVRNRGGGNLSWGIRVTRDLAGVSSSPDSAATRKPLPTSPRCVVQVCRILSRLLR